MIVVIIIKSYNQSLKNAVAAFKNKKKRQLIYNTCKDMSRWFCESKNSTSIDKTTKP